MKKIPEGIRLFLTANVNSKAAAIVLLVLYGIIAFVPAYTIERILLGNKTPAISAPFILLIVGLSAVGKTYTIYGICQLILWIVAAFTLSSSEMAEWMQIVFFIFMVIGILRVATIWWCNDNKSFGEGAPK